MKSLQLFFLSLGLSSGGFAFAGSTEAGLGGALGGAVGAMVGQQVGRASCRERVCELV